MKLLFDVVGKTQPDPFIFEDSGKYYLYVTAEKGVELYTADDPFATWHYEGVVTRIDGEGHDFWAPSVIAYEGKYYLYVSFTRGEVFEHLHVFTAASPLGPFEDARELYPCFSIDSHVVRTDAGLFLWYAKNNRVGERIGTQIYVDRLLDPYTPENRPIAKIVPTFDEEIFAPSYSEDNRWHTIEGPFWFAEGEWQYVMYSGGCYQDDTYHVGYARAKSREADLTQVTYEKFTDDGRVSPVLIKNGEEEGTGHHSVLKMGDAYYAIYHARDYGSDLGAEARTARICRLHVLDGVITAER